MTYAFHGALRRELGQIAGIIAETTDDPRRVLQAALGWELSRSHLHVHHGAEDDVLWPVIRAAVRDLPSEPAVIEAMEAEHAVPSTPA